MTDGWKLERFEEITKGILTRSGHELGTDWSRQQKIEFIDDILADYPQVANNTTVGDK